ncbi:unnamed protein product [Sphagnum jensenii]|uniref:Uncharacterized protein n=1 Tax=Sphagnum jensenii TaxID=128206 RepID=A0ABP0W789_9BRYO
MCGTASHHNHFFKPTGMPIINSTQCMTNPYNGPSCHAAAEQLQQHDAVAIREAVAALQAAAGSARSSPTRIVTSKKLQDGQQEEHHDATEVVADDQLGDGGGSGSGCMNQICEKNCEECGLTLINWGWPGCHMLCPFLPRHPDALSTSTHCPQEECTPEALAAIEKHCPAMARLGYHIYNMLRYAAFRVRIALSVGLF